VARASGLGNTDLTDLFADSALIAPGVKNHFQSILEASEPTWWTAASWERKAPAWRASPSPPSPPPDCGSTQYCDDDFAFVARVYG